MKTAFSDITGVVLAGGKSRRMGRDKRFLDLEGTVLMERVCAVVEPLFPEVLLSVAEAIPQLERLPYRLVVDEMADCATLGGLYTALSASNYPRIFAVGCDMPFITEDSIRQLVAMNEEYDIVMAELTTGLQPMHAVYSKACLPIMRHMIEDKNLKIQALVQNPGLRVKLVKEAQLATWKDQLLPFFNINTPSDLELAKKLLGASRSRSK